MTYTAIMLFGLGLLGIFLHNLVKMDSLNRKGNAFSANRGYLAILAAEAFSTKDEAGTASTGNITINRAGSDTIDGGTSTTMLINYQSVEIYSNGSNAWFTK